MVKKRVDVTIDLDLYKVIENMRSKERFKPPFSQIINSLLREIPEIKKKLNKKRK